MESRKLCTIGFIGLATLPTKFDDGSQFSLDSSITTVSPFLINPHYIQQQSSEQDASNDNTTGEDGVSSTAGGAINLSSRPSSVPESQATTQASVNPSTTPTLVEPDSQEDQVSFWCNTIFPTCTISYTFFSRFKSSFFLTLLT